MTQAQITNAKSHLNDFLSTGSQESRGKILKVVPSSADRIAVEKKLDAIGSEIQATTKQITNEAFQFISPATQPLPLLVTPTNKELAVSPYIYRQGAISATGYMWQDYYRPMTFNAALISLIRKTEAHWLRQALNAMQSAGVVAGALVGLDAISSEFVSRRFVDVVAVTTAAILPEARKLLLEDLNQFIINLGKLGLERVVEIGPNKSVDGYVFFPKGAIFGFGVSEFRPNEPAFIVNINNNNIAVDGILVDQSLEIASGEKDALIAAAEGRLESRRQRDEQKQQALEEKIRRFRLARLSDETNAMLKEGNTAGAAQLVESFVGTFGDSDVSGTLGRIRANIEGARISNGGIVFEGENGKRITALDLEEKAGEATNNQVTLEGVLKVRLNNRLGEGVSSLVTIQAPSMLQDRLKLTLKIEPSTGDKGSDTVSLKFIEPKQGETGHAWHEPYKIKIQLEVSANESVSPVKVFLSVKALSSDGKLFGDQSFPISIKYDAPSTTGGS